VQSPPLSPCILRVGRFAHAGAQTDVMMEFYGLPVTSAPSVAPTSASPTTTPTTASPTNAPTTAAPTGITYYRVKDPSDIGVCVGWDTDTSTFNGSEVTVQQCEAKCEATTGAHHPV
jgi:hypothetical protein